jgi:hypothetical protein
MSKHVAVSSNPSAAKTKKRERKKEISHMEDGKEKN